MGKKVNYDFAVISYIDVLGFRNLINTKSAGEISRIVRKLKERTKPGKEETKNHGMKFFNFSDTAIRIAPLNNPRNHGTGNLFWELIALVHVHYLLILEKIIVRGAVSIGSIVKSWGIVYGPGLVSAYEMEKKAVNPRIIVDPLVFKHLRTNPALWIHDYAEEHKDVMDLLRKDDDGKFFVDYLRVIEGEMGSPDIYYPRFLRTHAELIVEGLVRYRLDRKVVRKFKWLQKYHNSTVKKRFGKEVDRALLV